MCSSGMNSRPTFGGNLQLLLVVAVIGSLATGHVKAWGKVGHEVIGYVADALIYGETDKALKEIFGSFSFSQPILSFHNVGKKSSV